MQFTQHKYYLYLANAVKKPSHTQTIIKVFCPTQTSTALEKALVGKIYHTLFFKYHIDNTGYFAILSPL